MGFNPWQIEEYLLCQWKKNSLSPCKIIPNLCVEGGDGESGKLGKKRGDLKQRKYLIILELTLDHSTGLK